MSALVDRVLRDHVRYTGDGLPNAPTGAPLPIGDPASGVYHPRKSDLRDAMNETVDLAQAAADTAVALVQGYVGSFLTTSPAAGRGPYALPVNPGNSLAMEVYINGLAQVAGTHYTYGPMGGAPSGYGITLSDDYPAGALVSYRIFPNQNVSVVVGDEVVFGNGSPEGVVAASPGVIYQQRDGFRGGTLWVKSANTGTAGWIPLRHKYRSVTALTYSAAATAVKEVGNATTAVGAQLSTITINNGGAAYDVVIELSATNAMQGDYFDFVVQLPTLAGRRIIFKNGIGGTDILTGEQTGGGRFKGRIQFNGAAWVSAGFSQIVWG